ncbi:hypothetical protein [Priestia flexa]|uniref:hypothetical protein n=1 Tax=Priestia flexa TaxID=86664 RepID=UPI000473D4A8|nr:hypothetical protein [Priestia flexa]
MSEKDVIKPLNIEFNSKKEYQDFLDWAERKKVSPSERFDKLRKQFREYKAIKMKKELIKFSDLGIDIENDSLKDYEDEEGNVDYRFLIQDNYYNSSKGDI